MTPNTMLHGCSGRPLIGLNISTSTNQDVDPAAAAVDAERLGFDFVSMSDHPGAEGTFETWTLLTWVAAHTSSIKIAPRVLGIPFRNPALLAKMAESLQRLSEGRLILGLGAGGNDAELRSFGASDLSPGQRVQAMGEAVRIMRSAWSSASTSFEGNHHTSVGLAMDPKPEKPIPIWLGTFGPKAIAITGELADGWIPTLGYATEDALRAMRLDLCTSAARAGRDANAVASILNVQVCIAPKPLDDPNVVSGPAEVVTARLAGLLDIGFVGFNLLPTGPESHDQGARFMAEVMPSLIGADR
jgi:alkanesulfonate monooxygenase SsuD/methylene tetrahydromethanopterin reductase-like flavin-dependent oxidoreductase (luciferase family)